MKKLKVAIIDTGINLGHIFFKNQHLKMKVQRKDLKMYVNT
ncbi:S8 family peptidase [Peptostreptococcus anaerobius]|uniref:S8 family peptidase n=1 Tax=Peptostreptococcus porci TaxID=2652282 RepID=A0A6N7X3W1_9FIRM|nr:S8 family peptidase [Peptostreptococcus porci]MDD7182413.1 S8 family peptidase [Peptostreptococcus porci]MDY4127525.1 S8 family peptidase [Peptostreptococcus porci]MDY5964168.1 S8 family peptidase [Peptostreptococcus porci]MST62751.1 S8 family peptidase [Peptostreptococcus porci]